MKLLFSFLIFMTLPLTYIGGWWLVKISGIGPDGAVWLGVFGAFVMIFQGIMAGMLTLSYYKDKNMFENLK